MQWLAMMEKTANSDRNRPERPGAAAQDYAEIRSALLAKGKPIDPYDLLIAAHARHIGATVVTNNEREFCRIFWPSLMHVTVLPMFVVIVVVPALVMLLAVIVGRSRITLGPPGFLRIDSRREREAQ